jgi:hypothetical protein
MTNLRDCPEEQLVYQETPGQLVEANLIEM